MGSERRSGGWAAKLARARTRVRAAQRPSRLIISRGWPTARALSLARSLSCSPDDLGGLANKCAPASFAPASGRLLGQTAAAASFCGSAGTGAETIARSVRWRRPHVRAAGRPTLHWAGALVDCAGIPAPTTKSTRHLGKRPNGRRTYTPAPLVALISAPSLPGRLCRSCSSSSRRLLSRGPRDS